jgi:hypothetical protein
VMVQMGTPDHVRAGRNEASSSGEDLSQHQARDAPPPAVEASALFQMGFAPEDVGNALVQTRGDVRRALSMLSAAHSQGPTEHVQGQARVEEDEDAELARAIELSLEPTPTAQTMRQTAFAQNPLWDPPRYVPAGGTDALRVIGGKTLNLVEAVHVRDGGYTWQPATAFLDTGNQHMTIVDELFATRHAIHRAGTEERWTTLHGVVPGASSRAPCVTIAVKLRGEEFIIQAAVSRMGGGQDLLIGVDVLGRLFASGFRIGSGSL